MVEEVAGLWQWEAEARWDTEDIEKMFQDLSVRAWQDEEEAARVRKDWDELLQRDAEARRCVLNLLGEVEKERELKLATEERFMAL